MKLPQGYLQPKSKGHAKISYVCLYVPYTDRANNLTIGLRNGLVPGGAKPLSEPSVTYQRSPALNLLVLIHTKSHAEECSAN